MPTSQPIQTLILRSVAGDRGALDVLWPKIERFGIAVLKCAFRRSSLPSHLADDFAQDFRLHLIEHALKRIRDFHGEDEQELRAFIRTSAWRFLKSRVRAHLRQQRRDQESVRNYQQPSNDPLAEAELLLAFEEFLNIARGDDEEGFRACREFAIGTGLPLYRGRALTGRRLSRLRLKLYRQYAHRIIWGERVRNRRRVRRAMSENSRSLPPGAAAENFRAATEIGDDV
jgi:DNA-directed RNA polymerase specialized sigma24 family protein